MKKIVLIFSVLISLSFWSCNGCSDKAKEAGKQTKEAMDEVSSDLKKVGEDALEKAKDVGDDMKKAGEQVMDSIEKTGNEVKKTLKDSLVQN